MINKKKEKNKSQQSIPLLDLEQNQQNNSNNNKNSLGFGGQKNHEENAGFFSKFSYHWANKLIWHSYKNVLEQHHIWNLASYDQSDVISEKLSKQWETEKSKPFPSFRMALIKAFAPLFVVSWVFSLIHMVSQFIGPILLQKIIAFIIENREGRMEDKDKYLGYIYSVILLGWYMIGSFCFYQSSMITARTANHLKTSMIVHIYRKILVLGNNGGVKTSNGEIINLMSNDTQRIVEMILVFNNGLFAFPQIVICTVLLYQTIGWPTFVAFGLVSLTFPINSLLTKKALALRRGLIGFTDARIKITNEILKFIKGIKLYSWEDSFRDRVNSKRNLEIFSAIAYLNLLKVPLASFPIFFGLIVQLNVSIDRIKKFLLLPELEVSYGTDDPNLETGVYIDGNAKFIWQEKGDTTFELKDINLEFSGSSLSMVVGSVGSGKSSLCNAILGEMDKVKGDVQCKGKIAYVPQQAWIFNASLRENILLGSEFDSARYNKVLEACSLTRDIELFPNGDQVEIGERGLTLSGGQRQRVSIARAVYNNSNDIYLLDDPLSAVDAHVGRHLFHKCFKGILKGKTVILITNQLNYIPHADQVILLKNGTVSERGTFKSILESGQEFSTILQKYGINHETTVHEEELDVETNEDQSEEEVKEEITDKGNLTVKEERETGSVGMNIYYQYFKVGGGLLSLFSILMYISEAAVKTLTDWWLSYWSNQWESDSPTLTNTQFLAIYIAFGISNVIFTAVRGLSFFHYSVKAGRELHNMLFNALLSAPMWFFDQTPLGRIMNRLSKDQDVVDNLISSSLSHYMINFFSVIATLVLVSIVIPIILVPLTPIAILIWAIQYIFRFTSRELQRLESISRSPIFSHFSETLNGIPSIRSYRKQSAYIDVLGEKINENSKCFLTLQAMNQWLGLRLEIMGNFIIFFTCLFVVIDQSTISIASIGLALSNIFSITVYLNKTALQAADSETKMNSVERIYQYINGPVEPPQITNIRPSSDWPKEGSIQFDNVVLRYREDLDPVLKGISFEIQPREKIGIVGRTGSGKSSIVLALFRLVEIMDGLITIDGLDISEIGLKDLRRHLAIIPQDPILFEGTLRQNLDPFNEYTDYEIWNVLNEINLKEKVTSMEGLESKVVENGDNWSIGEKQIICLGRCLLMKPKILVLDEATASVDSDTDQLIQRKIREKFQQTTVLTIAHRLNTIMDSDRILVLDSNSPNNIAEFDKPWTLLQNPNGLLSYLANETGTQNSELLHTLAKISFKSF
eukprot:gene9298-11395_t